ncbi:MAG: S8 family serine peptidase, partial [Eubacteriales bacterium]|nr:S8 family serine peptidase [Eubacteriales bacterium]
EVAVARTGAVLLRLPEGRLVQDALRQLQADPGVEYAEPNRQRKVTRLAAASVSEDTYLDLQWNLPAVRAFEAWRELEVISGSVTVAVVDTGVDPSHPELSGRIASGGRNFVATRSDGTSYNPDDTSDDHGHGTHVAGIITAVYGNGRGLAGVAGPASIPVLPVKVLNDQGWGTSFAVGRGIIHAADQGARVINLSLGGPIYSRFEAEAVAYALQRDCLVVAAAGNEGIDADDRIFPAALPGVLTVAATDQGDRRAGFSNFGDCVEIAAPGVGILSPVPAPVGGAIEEAGFYYDYYDGTSMAAPHVAAAGALFLLNDPGASAGAAFAALTGTAVDRGDPGRDPYFGWGLLNVAAALGHEPKPEDEVQFVSPEAGDALFGAVALTARVARPEQVSHLAFYLNNEETALGRVYRAGPEVPQALFTFNWDSAARDDQGGPRYPDGEHRLVAVAFGSDNQKLGEAALPVRLKNSAETGLSFQILDPAGQPAAYALVTVLTRERFPYGGHGGPAGVGVASPPPGGEESQEGYWYRPVTALTTDSEGRVRIPGTLAQDLLEFVVVAQGVFNDGGRDASFLYQRHLEGPRGMVIDGSNAEPVFLQALDKDGALLPQPAYRAAVLDEEGVPYTFAFLSTTDLLSRMTAYIDRGTYHFSALAEAPGGTYLLFREGQQVAEGGGTITLDGRRAGALKPSLAPGQEQVLLYIFGEQFWQFGLWHGLAADVVYLSPGTYHYAADIFQKDSGGTTWLYEMYRPEGVTLVPEEVKEFSFGGDFTVALDYLDPRTGAVIDSVYQEEGLLGANRFTDTAGHQLLWVWRNVAPPPSGEALKLSLPGAPPVYRVPGAQGTWQEVAPPGPEPKEVLPHFTLRDAVGTVVAKTYGSWGWWWPDFYLPLHAVSPGDYVGRVEARPGPIAATEPLFQERDLTVLAGGPVEEGTVSTTVYGLDDQPVAGAELRLYQYREEYGWSWPTSWYSDRDGKITIPVNYLTSWGEGPAPVNAAVVGYRTPAGDSAAVLRAFRGAALPAEISAAAARPVTQAVCDRNDAPVDREPAVIFTPVLENTSLPGLKVYPDHLGAGAQWGPNTTTVHLEPGSYHFVSQFELFTGAANGPPAEQWEAYYLIVPDVSVGANGAQVVLDGRETARLELEVQGEGYLKGGNESYWWQGPIFLPFSRYDNSLEGMPFGTVYLSSGVDYQPLADITRSDPERENDTWNYLLAWGDGKEVRFTSEQEVSRSFGGEYRAELKLGQTLYTRVDEIRGETVFQDTYENRLVDLFIWSGYDYGPDGLSQQGKPPVGPQFSLRSDGRIAVKGAQSGEKGAACGWYALKYVDPFLYFYRGTGPAAERVFRDSGFQYYRGFSVPAAQVGTTTGPYRAEVALGAGPAGPVRSPADQGIFTFSGGGIAISVPGAVDADGENWLNRRTFTIRGLADGGASVSLFVYQGDTPGASPDYTVTTGADGRFEQAVTVGADGAWNILAEQADQGYRAIVMVQVDTAAPAAPTNLTAVSDVDGRKVTLNWDQAPEQGLTARIERSAAGGAFTLLAERHPGASYSDATAQPGISYTYRVAWVDRAGNVSPWATVQVSTAEPVRIISAGVVADTGPSGFLKPDKDLRITARGTAGAAATAQALLITDGREKVEAVILAEQPTAGTYAGTLKIAPGITRVQRIDVTLTKSGQTSRTLDALGGHPREVGGTVVGAVYQNDRPVSGARVGIFARGGDALAVTTGADGGFGFEGLRPATYTLR